ncbi:MAG TPA: glycosyltransferase family 2 protein [Pyrinomonadaceae bacterium]|nr:glycosyltransferase family 2 protein [Pyrinomonadaceae bacterium]
MLHQITPLILTYNEAPNIGRNLRQLSWARDIVVVDSFSDDETIELSSSFPHVRVFQRPFDSHQQQWTFGLAETGISTPWILALDADYILTDEFISELAKLEPDRDARGYSARFIYCIRGKRLRSDIYPSVTILYRRDSVYYEQDGHTQRVHVEGEVRNLDSPVLHDDRKSLRHWVVSQVRYAELEAQKLRTTDRASLSLADRIRCWGVVAPPVMMLYCLIVRGGILDGWAGIHYAFERVLAELILSLYLIGERIGLQANLVEVPGDGEPDTSERTELKIPSTS